MKCLLLPILALSGAAALKVQAQETVFKPAYDFTRKAAFYTASYFEGNEFYLAITDRRKIYRHI